MKCNNHVYFLIVLLRAFKLKFVRVIVDFKDIQHAIVSKSRYFIVLNHKLMNQALMG